MRDEPRPGAAGRFERWRGGALLPQAVRVAALTRSSPRSDSSRSCLSTSSDTSPLSERLDAEEVRELLDGYFATAREIVDRHGGVIEKFIGDAVLMAVWGTPVAHEDDAERAVRTALQLVEAVARYRSRERPSKVGPAS